MSSLVGITETEDLTLFVQEKVQVFDPTIDTNTGSSFFSTVIQPLLNRLGPDPFNTPVREFILGRLSSQFPELVLQDGEAIDDLVVKPMQVLLEAFRRQIQQVSNNQSFEDPSILNEREADALGANFFEKRRLGGVSIGVARLFFSAPQGAIVTPSNAVFDAAGHRFFPIENQAISADNMLFNIEDNLYFFDVITRAEEEGSDFNIDPNTLVGIEEFQAAVKVSNKATFEEGIDRESTVDFVERTENGLTEKSLVTVRGINARMRDVFENIRLIQVIGHGDPEMNRDILTGAVDKPAPFAYFNGDTTAAVNLVTLTGGSSILLPTGAVRTTFISAGFQVGDSVLIADVALGTVEEHTITAVGTTTLGTALPVTATVSGVHIIATKPQVSITISDIPGGILEPTTANGEIVINNNEVHLGGALDVYVRAGAPLERETILTGVLDGSPLHFGVDLESFGERLDVPVHITPLLAGQALRPSTDRFGNAVTDHVLIRQLDWSADPDDPVVPWKPEDSDVSRFVQLLPSGGAPQGLLEVLEVLSEEYYSDGGSIDPPIRVVRIKVSLTNQEDPSTGYVLGSLDSSFDTDFRLVEITGVKDRVRDRDGSRLVFTSPDIASGSDLLSLGAVVGDSVVIETGEDAGIYSIRRILDWLDTGDTLILDRDLTKTKSALGGGTGLRYRIADELNVDLVSPRTTKIPLGTVFPGDDLSTTSGNTEISVTGTTNFLLAGVEVGDTLEILEGDDAGTFQIQSVTGITAVLDRSPSNTAFALTFSVYRSFAGIDRPMVRVKEVELLDSNSQPTGITIPYGNVIDARALGLFSNRAEGIAQESFTGETQVGTGALNVRLFDANVDFVAEGVVPGFRLTVLNTNNAAGYTIVKVGSGDGLPSNNYIEVETAALGGIEFTELLPAVHYIVGLPSAGVARIYFQEPTTVEIQTGLSGGRINFEEEGTPRQFHFSAVDGTPILPAPGSDETRVRDIRVVRNYETSTPNEFETVLEITDNTRPGVFELEIVEGDLVEVNEQIQFRHLRDLVITYTWDGTVTVLAPDTSELSPGMLISLKSDGQFFRVVSIVANTSVLIDNPLSLVIPSGATASEASSTLDQLGVFGAPAGLGTVAGSNLVTVPANSLIDFVDMNAQFPLAGQLLFIDSGSDAGEFVIEEVVNSKTLRLDRVMTASTETIVLQDTATLRDATLAAGVSTHTMSDPTNSPGVIVGAFITIFESTRGDLEGTFEIASIPSPGVSVEIDMDPSSFPSAAFVGLDIIPFGTGLFGWINTTGGTNVSHTFRIYRAVPTQAAIVQVATQRNDIDIRGRGDVTSTTDFEDLSATWVTDGVKPGDRIEILTGSDFGVYPIESLTETTLVIVDNASHRFLVPLSNAPYVISGGLHGSRRMVTVGNFESDDGQIAPGVLMPYRVLRPGLFRLSSTEMVDNEDNSFQFIDIQVESLGSGDEFNLDRNDRMVVKSGVEVDGYTYSVDNNNLTFSPFEEVSLTFDRRFLPVGNSDSPENLTEVSGRNLKVVYELSTTAKLLHDLMRSESERPVNANPLGRHFLPSFVFFNMTYRGGSSSAIVGQAVEDYLNSLGATDTIEISDLEAFATLRGATSIDHPLILAVITHDIDRALVVNRTENRLGGTLAVPYNGTGRLSAFIAKLGEGLVVERES